MKNLLTAALVAATATYGHAQYFQATHGTTSLIERLSSGHNTNIGAARGHFMVGPTDINAFPEIIVQRTDLAGSSIAGAPYFSNVYGINLGVWPFNALDNYGARSMELSNGTMYGLTGGYYDQTANNWGIYGIGLNGNGTVAGARGFVPNNPALWGSMQVTSMTPSALNANDIYITGWIREATTGFPHVFIIKFDYIANAIVWSNVYDLNTNINYNYELPYGIVESANFNPMAGATEVMVVGNYYEAPNFNTNVFDAFVLRVDQANGVPTANAQMYGAPNPAVRDGFSGIRNSANINITPTADGYVISGTSDLNGTDDFWFVAINQAGAISWSNVFDNSFAPGTSMDQCRDLTERINTAAQFEYYLVGSASNGQQGASDMFVCKADQAGNPFAGQPQFFYGTTGNEYGAFIDYVDNINVPTDGLAMFGSMDVGGGDYDHYLVKSYFNGFTQCNYTLSGPNQATGPGAIYTTPVGMPDNFGNQLITCGIISSGSENIICTANSVTGGSNAREQLVAPKSPFLSNAPVLYPNPVEAGAGTVDVKLSPDAKGVSEIRVTDLLGRVYHTSSVVGNYAKIKLPALKSGSYLVVVTSGNKVNKSILMVK